MRRVDAQDVFAQRRPDPLVAAFGQTDQIGAGFGQRFGWRSVS
jgi:hypothetical protein